MKFTMEQRSRHADTVRAIIDLVGEEQDLGNTFEPADSEAFLAVLDGYEKMLIAAVEKHNGAMRQENQQ